LVKYLKEFEKNSDRYLKDDDYVRENYNFFKNFIKKENLKKAEWKDFQKMGNYIHSFKSMAIAKANALGNPNHPIEHYRNSFLYLIYGEDPEEQRIRNFCENEVYILKYFGNSAIGEIIGNALAADFIFMNRRDKFALEFLGYSPKYKRGDKFIDKFLKFNEAAKPIVEKYEKFVGRKTDLPINLEVDQFFSYLYDTYSKKETKIKDTQSDDFEKQYWLLAPGREAKHWQDFQENNIVAIGWDKINNIREFANKKQMEDELIKQYGYKNKPIMNSKCLDEFANKLKKGDLVFIKQGRKIILGFAIIESDYFYDSNRDHFKHCRKVKWLKTGEWKYKHTFALKTLTNITKYPEFVEELKTLLEIEETTPDVVDEIQPKSITSYSSEQALKELFIEEDKLQSIINTLKYKKNIILQGAPGVGKTYIAKRIAWSIMGEKDKSRVEMIQFHQSYSYEDFIQGYRPTDEGGFEIKNGVFYDFSKKAQRNPEKEYFFIIDEINRGNLSKIFGELMMLIEKDKRGKDFAIPLTYSKNEVERFYLPENLYFIGTMNTADRSLAMVDYALRRRFGFITLEPAFTKPKFKKYLADYKVPKELIAIIIERMNSLNENINKDNKNLGEGYRIGHSYFCPVNENDNDIEWYKSVIKNEIEPLLKEYWFDNKELVKAEIKKIMDV